MKNELFWAERGQGAFMNSKRLRVSGRRSLDVALLATGMPYKGRKSGRISSRNSTWSGARTAGIRRMGSAALDLAYVAAGRYEGFWEYGLSPWDSAAGTILVTEAGGFVGEVDGGTNPIFGPSILAANGDLSRPIRDLLRRAGGKPANGPKAVNG